ncbi:hypothetical protein P278_29350 [Zhouia amylolytica AD3]|uniref:Uncharacterized protein n=1 Tax=Zhouia amylolytica AD3 TaxID=1286632 RepID=W2UL08_9FLAO|nr:hypothetical protein P278_29350 [Zhouia amylolytica AD3]
MVGAFFILRDKLSFILLVGKVLNIVIMKNEAHFTMLLQLLF